ELTLRLTAVAVGYGITYEGQLLSQASDPEELIRTLHLIINQLVLDPQQDVLRIHAGAGTWQNRFFIATGNRGAGKTTLLLKLMLDGAEVHCDETVLLRDGQVQTFPRKFYVKSGALRCLPRIAGVCAGKRSYPGFFGGRLYFADPTDWHKPWRSRRGRPKAIFHLTPAFDQPPHVQPCPKVNMAQHLLCQTLNAADNFGGNIAQICRLVDACPCYSLRVGPLAATATLVRKTLA
ncbi:MAG: hypothetical protein NTV49_16745, partial [Kiritimatiellaeota bacterium]|nr:hypothetical protein [Kiritimatiellota bacterium]